MSEKLAKINPEDFGLDVKKATTIESAFAVKVSESEGYLQVYNNVIKKGVSKETCKEAYELRKKLVKARTGIAEIHKTEKAFYLAGGRYVDALKNKLTLPITQMEEKLREIEDYYINLEKEKINQLQNDRANELLKYEVENIPNGLGLMDNDFWGNYLTGVKTSFEAKKEAERQAEQARIEAEHKEFLLNTRKDALIDVWGFVSDENKSNVGNLSEEQYKIVAIKAIEDLKKKEAEDERIREENEKLRLAKIEAEKKAKAEREKIEAKAKKERLVAAKKLEVEKRAKAKIEAELKAKKEAEAKEMLAKIEAEKKAALAPDKEKLKAFCILLGNIEIPEVKSAEAAKIANDAKTLLQRIVNHIEDNLDKL